MLDFIYYAVSFILWCWHKVFGFILGPANFITWALSIILLVFTLRLVLLKPAIHQIRSMRKMQKVAPEMKKIQKKYANDRQRQAQEMQKLQREHGVNPIGGCLPMLLQIPVFIGLNHVLRSFREGTTEVYFFKVGDVKSYLDAKLFGAHLGDAIFGLGPLGGPPGFHWGVAPVAIPLMIAASVATHFTARLSVQRQAAMGTAATSQTAIMNKVTLYLFPLGLLVFGGGFPIGLLIYFLSNNLWTLGQQHFVFTKMDREDEQQKAEALEAQKALAPRPGQKPDPSRKRPRGNRVEDAVPDVVDATDEVNDAVPVEDAVPATDRKPPNKPAPGAKPNRDPRRAVKPTVPNPNKAGANKGTANKPAGTAAANKAAGGKATGGRTNGARTNGAATGATEVSGLSADRSRRKKQDRKRG